MAGEHRSKSLYICGEEYNETTNILTDGYMVLDEDGGSTMLRDNYDESQENLVVGDSAEDDYIYLDENDMQDYISDQHYDDNEVAYQEEENTVQHEHMETEDGRLEPAFVAIDEDLFVKQEMKEEIHNNNEFEIGCDDGSENFEGYKEEPLEKNEVSFESYFEVLSDRMEPEVQTNDDVKFDEHLKEKSVFTVRYLVKQHDAEINEDQLSESLIKQESCTQSENDSSNGEKFFCEECQMVFNDLQSAEDHECFATSTEQNIEAVPRIPKGGCYGCTFCHSRLKSFGGFQRHQLNCRMKPPSLEALDQDFKCPMCLKLYPTEKSLQAHKRTHEVPESNHSGQSVCDICNTVFTSSKNLKLHRKIHDKKPIKSIQQALPAGAEVEYNELNQFFCEICNKSFDQNLLAVHKNMHQNLEEYNCRVCNRQFENMPSYEMHMQLHTDKIPERRGVTKAERAGKQLPFPCNYCGREFARPHEKVKHERIHTGEKPYECEVCGKTFRVSYSLTLHLRTHTDIRPYVCATCNKRFKSQPVYAHHLNTHLAERPYKCNICSKSFRTSVQLCGHKNSHTKPFNCIECNRPFATLYAVKIHMKTHNKANKWSENLKHRCSVCGAEYARIFALRYHMKEQHSIDFDNKNQQLELENSADTDTAVDVVSSTEIDDEDAAVLIAAAAEATVNANIAFQTQNGDRNDHCFNEDSNISTQGALQSEEEECSIIVDNFHTEEIVTDWLMK